MSCEKSLAESLLDGGGVLLLHGLAGLDKTREIADLAETVCHQPGWIVCISRGGDADKALNRLAGFL